MVTKATNSVLNLVSPPIDNMVLLQGTLDNVVIGFHVPNLGRFTEVVTNEIIAISGTLDNVVIGATVPNVAVFTNVTAANVYVSSAFTIANSQVGAVLVGSNTNPVVGIAPGSAGSTLISNGFGVNPSWGFLDLANLTGVLTVPHGGTGQTDFPFGSVLIGDNTNAITWASPGTAGFPLVSNGAGQLPSFQDRISVREVDTTILEIGGTPIKIITQDTNFYLGPGGNDSTGDGSFGNPWLTLSHAYNTITAGAIFGGGRVILNLFDGSYNGDVNSFSASVGTWTIQGYTGSLHYTDLTGGVGGPFYRGRQFTENVVIHVNGVNVECIQASQGASVKTGWMLLASDQGACIASTEGATVETFYTYFATSLLHTNIFDGGVLNITTDYTITGSAAWHLFCSGGRITASSSSQPVTVDSSTTVNFSNAFAGCSDGGFIRAIAANYSAVVAFGSRFIINTDSIIDTGGSDRNTYFPGSSPGSDTANGVDNAGLYK